jgi:polyisoprenoid-binding protein YceI
VASSDGLAMVVIKTDSVDVKGRLIENMVKGESFFDVDNHPEILFVSKSFEWTGEDRAVLKGDLTLRGITRPVVFDVTLTSIDGTWTDKAEKILVKATTSIERTAFGMKALSSMVDDTVTLCMSVEALA